MAERKAKMIELGDAFIAFPGGTGTLEEIAEVMSAVSLGHLDAPCILYNLNGYYNDLKALLEHMIDKGLSSPRRQQGIYFAEICTRLLDYRQLSLDLHVRHPTAPFAAWMVGPPALCPSYNKTYPCRF